MAGKITELTELTTPVSGDLIEIVDISDTTDSANGTNKKITYSNMQSNLSITTSQISDITTTAAEINVLDGIPGTLTATEIGYLDGVTSAIQTQLDAKGTLSNLVEDTTPQLGGDLDWNSNGTKLVSQTVGGSDGNLVYLSGSDTWSQADASAEATANGQLGIRISATEVLTKGVYTTSGLTAGSIYYMSETAGAITTTAPTTSASIVRPIGYALTTTELFVDPSKSWVENI